MKVWQLMNILSGNKELLTQLKKYDSQEVLPNSIVIALLSQSEELFSVCTDGNLRSESTKYSFDIGVKEELNAVEAFQRYGGNALCEVIDFGSCNIPENYSQK